MNRVEIKEKAKEMIKGNKWFIWKPLIILWLVVGIASGVAFGLDSALGLAKSTTVEYFGVQTTQYSAGIFTNIVSIVISFVSSAFSVAYAYYVLSFVRGKKLELSDIIDFMKKNWVIAFATGLLSGLNIAIGYILLIIPGIIATIGLMFYREVCADNPKMKVTDILRKAWSITNGHKMDLFVFGLSFLGWIMLAPFTLGILYIWLMPYMIVAATLAYEELRK